MTTPIMAAGPASIGALPRPLMLTGGQWRAASPAARCVAAPALGLHAPVAGTGLPGPADRVEPARITLDAGARVPGGSGPKEQP